MRWFFAGLLVLGALFLVADPSRAADEAEILIEQSGFSPSTVTITLGDAVYWCNNDAAHHRVVFDAEGGPDSGDLAPDDCTNNLVLSEAKTYTYHEFNNAQMTGTIVVGAATTTTAAPTTTASTPGPTTPTTVRATSTTRKKVTTTAAFKKSATRELTTSTTALETTTSFFDTTTSEETTTTGGTFAIQETSDGDGGSAWPLVLSGTVILGGAGYLGYRYRYRFLR
jgi:plastocyanin